MTERLEKLSPEKLLKVFNTLIRSGQWKLHIESRFLIRVRNVENN